MSLQDKLMRNLTQRMFRGRRPIVRRRTTVTLSTRRKTLLEKESKSETTTAVTAMTERLKVAANRLRQPRAKSADLAKLARREGSR